MRRPALLSRNGAAAEPVPLLAEAAALARALAGLLAAVPAPTLAEVADARVFLEDWAASAPDGPAAPLDRVVGALGLSPLERRLVVLAGMGDEHEGLAAVFRRLHPAAVARPTAGLAAQLVGHREELRDALASGPAVAAGLLRVDGDGPVPDRTLALPNGLWAALAGLAPRPDAAVTRLGAAAGAVPAAEAPAAGLERWLAAPASARATQALAAGEGCTVAVLAVADDVALPRALALVAAAGRRAVTGRAEDTAALILHALARDAVPVAVLTAPSPDVASAPPVRATVPPGPLVAPLVLCAAVSAPLPPTPPGRPLVTVRAEPLSPHARRAMWRALLPELAADAAELAARRAVEPAVARQVAADARLRARLDARPPHPDDVAASVRARTAGALPAGATLRRPTAGWDALVLPQPRVMQLRDAAERVRHQALVLDDWGFLAGRPGARGVRVLLSGPPGTGKTLATEVLARELGVDLLQVDLSRILSKWIGETEKHLAEVFDAAERSQAVLFFDEADGLFGKRTEVHDAHDRHANLETAYLLQRLEQFDGLAVLATNLRENVDEAFIRRLECVVELAEPTAPERARLWAAHLPPAAPLADDLDLPELAEHHAIVGGLIRNAAVAAAFLAAADGEAISRRHVLRALRREYDKHGRAFPGPSPDVLDPVC